MRAAEPARAGGAVQAAYRPAASPASHRQRGWALPHSQRARPAASAGSVVEAAGQAARPAAAHTAGTTPSASPSSQGPGSCGRARPRAAPRACSSGWLMGRSSKLAAEVYGVSPACTVRISLSSGSCRPGAVDAAPSCSSGRSGAAAAAAAAASPPAAPSLPPPAALSAPPRAASSVALALPPLPPAAPSVAPSAAPPASTCGQALQKRKSTAQASGAGTSASVRAACAKRAARRGGDWTAFRCPEGGVGALSREAAGGGGRAAGRHLDRAQAVRQARHVVRAGRHVLKAGRRVCARAPAPSAAWRPDRIGSILAGGSRVTALKLDRGSPSSSAWPDGAAGSAGTSSSAHFSFAFSFACTVPCE